MDQKNKKILLLPLAIIGFVVLVACNKQYKPVKQQIQVKNNQGIYAPMIRLAQTIDYPQSKRALKKQIMIHNDQHNKKREKSLFGAQYQDLPFIQYKSLLDREVKQLERKLRKLRKKKTQNYRQENEIRALIAQLTNLNHIIITSDEYYQEKLKLAEQKSGLSGIFNFGLGSLARKVIPI